MHARAPLAVLSLLHSVHGPVHEMVLPTFRLGLGTSLKPTEKFSHRHAYRPT